MYDAIKDGQRVCCCLVFEGPGCSSVGAGAFVEHGPFKPTENGLEINDYSWNKG